MNPASMAEPISRSSTPRSDRPDHATVAVEPDHAAVTGHARSATIAAPGAHHISPPASHSGSPMMGRTSSNPSQPAQFSSKFGGFGSDQLYNGTGGAGTSEKQPFLGAAGGSAAMSRSSSHASGLFDDAGASSGSGLKRWFTIIGGFICVVFFVRHLAPAGPAQLKQSVSPYLPSSFFTLISPYGQAAYSPHPIMSQLVTAQRKWDQMLLGQSRTYDRAVRTYRSRYNRSPPAGFDRWYAFATYARNHTLVDEYDALMSDLAPFRQLGSAELRRRIAELAQIPGISIVSIRKGQAQVHSKSGRWAPALAFQQMISAFVRELPDMDIPINEKPEGRVLPRQQRVIAYEEYGMDAEAADANLTDPILHPTLKRFTSEWHGESTVWDSFRRSCPPDSASRRLVESVRSAETTVGAGATIQGRTTGNGAPKRRSLGLAVPPARELTFSRDLDAGLDICARPSLHALHSAFYSDQRSIEFLYPVFSPSKPPGYADILIPPHNYWAPSSEFTYEYEFKRGRTTVPTDVPWEMKKSTSYWRGKVTRGAESPPGHASSFQKQRLVKMGNSGSDRKERVLVELNETTTALESISAPMADVNKALTDIAMACDPKLGECAYLRSLGYRVEPPAPMSEAWKHKYVLDIDEIGFSPRFLALMESHSAVIKSSIQREFWRGWSVPWKHFIPLSSSYAELYNIQTFFSGVPNRLVAKSSTDGKMTLTHPPTPRPPLPHIDGTTADGEEFHTDAALRAIAESGREWQQQHMRKADMECYVYRLMIEWAAMLAPEA